MNSIPHGTHGGYTNHNCRCEACCEAKRAYQRDYERRRRLRVLENVNHGSVEAYESGCRCEECLTGRQRRYMRGHREEKRVQLDLDPSVFAHGVNETYSLGCRCEYCRRARLEKRLDYSYGMSLDEYEALVEAQNGVCANCHRKPKGKKRNDLEVDHAHDTGKVRGLLCSTCNTGIGKLGDTIDGLKRAITYLETVEKRMNSAKISL